MEKKVVFFSLGLLLIFSISITVESQQRLTLTLVSSPETYSGPCPATIQFKGKIAATEAGVIQYKFIRSDGAQAPTQSLNFEGPGSKDVVSTWTIGKDYSGWVAIQVISPAAMESNKANFKIICQGSQEKPAAPVQPSTKIKAMPKKATMAKPLPKKPGTVAVPPSTTQAVLQLPGLILGLRNVVNQEYDPFIEPQAGIPLIKILVPGSTPQKDAAGQPNFEFERLYWWTIPDDMTGEPQGRILPPGLVFALSQSEYKEMVYESPKAAKDLTSEDFKEEFNPTLFRVDPVFGPEYLPGGFFKKENGGDIGAPSGKGFFWYESTGLNFSDWSVIERLPRGTVVCLKHSLNQPGKVLVWQGRTYDPVNPGITPPPGFARKFGGDIGAPTGQGFYWYEKITGQ